MNVLMLSNLFPPDVLGGYELLAADVARKLGLRGHRVDVLTTGRPRATDPDWVHRRLELVRPFGTEAGLERGRHLRLGWAHRAVAREIAAGGRFDAVLVMSLRRLGFHAVRALSRLSLQPVFCLNDEWPLAHRPGLARTPLRGWGLGLLERLPPFADRTWAGVRTDRSLFISGALRARFKDQGAPFDGPVCLQGVDLGRFSPRAPRPFSGTPRLLFVGRLDREKACDHAIDALSALHRSGHAAQLTIAGRGSEESALRAHAEALGVSDAVTWLGQVARGDLTDVYRSHDVFLFPSRWDEPAGLTHLEALACGVPVVANPRGGVAEMLAHEEECLVAKDGVAMAAAALRVGADAALRHSMHRAGLKMVRERASLDRYVDAIERLLRSAADH